jgi:hypothetical protein
VCARLHVSFPGAHIGAPLRFFSHFDKWGVQHPDALCLHFVRLFLISEHEVGDDLAAQEDEEGAAGEDRRVAVEEIDDLAPQQGAEADAEIEEERGRGARGAVALRGALSAPRVQEGYRHAEERPYKKRP